MISPDAKPYSPTLATSDRRCHSRYSVQVQIEIHPEASKVPLRVVTTDLSLGGCYVEMLVPFSVGIRVRATLWLDGCAIVVRGLVVTRHPQFGNGIMFVEFQGEGEQLLSRYLSAVTKGP